MIRMIEQIMVALTHALPIHSSDNLFIWEIFLFFVVVILYYYYY